MQLRHFAAALLLLWPTAPASSQPGARPITAEDLGGGASGRIGSFGFAHGLSVWTDVPRDGKIQDLRHPGLATMVDGRWLRWRARWDDAQIVDLYDFSITQPGSLMRLQTLRLPDAVPGERGCQALSSTPADGARAFGLWRCASWPGTVLAVARQAPAGGWQFDEVMRLTWRLDHITSTVEGHIPVRRVPLITYDREARRFDYVELAWLDRPRAGQVSAEPLSDAQPRP